MEEIKNKKFIKRHMWQNTDINMKMETNILHCAYHKSGKFIGYINAKAAKVVK